MKLTSLAGMKNRTFLLFCAVSFVVGFFGSIFYRYFTLSHTTDSQIYTMPYPAINPNNQYISQIGKINAPELKQNERGLHVPILMYHYISTSPWENDVTRIGLSTPPYIFEQQLKLLAQNGYTAITLTDLFHAYSGACTLPSKPVILTFDDGYEDFYLNAYPLLQKYDMKGINFVITDFVGKFGYLTWDEIEEMGTSSAVMIGAHTSHHLPLAQVSSQTAQKEIMESKQILERHINGNIEWFAYPYGSYSRKIADLVKQAGFFGAVTTLPGAVQYESRLFYITRFRAGTKLGSDFLLLVE